MTDKPELSIENKINYMVNWFLGRRETTFYSQSLRLGQMKDGKYGYDCSSALYFSLIDSGFLPRGTNIGWTATLAVDLPKICTPIKREECSRGDIFLSSPNSQSGHTGLFISNTEIISMQWGKDGTLAGGAGIKIQPADWMGSAPRYYYRINGSSGNINPSETFPTPPAGNVKNHIFYVQYAGEFIETKINVGNLIDELVNLISKKLNIEKDNIEPQLLNAEFSEIKLYDGYGNAYYFNPYLIEQGENNLLVNGTIGDSNQVHYTLEKYGFVKENKNNVKFQYGIMDKSPKSLTVISDNVETLFQSKKNQIEAQQSSFNENRDLMKKQIKLNNSQTGLANAESTYNLQYAVDSANLGMTKSVISTASSVLGNLFSMNIGGALSAGVSGGFNIYDSYRQVGNANKQQEFGEERNSLRSQANSLSAMASKQALNQSVRAFNASIKDVENQPSTILNMGDDLSFQGGHKFNDLYIDFCLPSDFVLKLSYDYIKRNGVMLNEWYNDIRAIFYNRKNYNYIQATNLFMNHLEANQSHKEALAIVFATGTRIWNYNSELENNYMKDVVNNDN